jgi:hypothetical protein
MLGARILSAGEVLLHCAALYRALGAEPQAQIALGVRYGGLKGRTFRAGLDYIGVATAGQNLLEDEVTVPPMMFRLNEIRPNLRDLVKGLCKDLFMIFDFQQFEDSVYQRELDISLKPSLAG